jgi:hypothetical protein
MNKHGLNALEFPRRKIGNGSVDAATTKKAVEIQPTQWGLWTERSLDQIAERG